MSTVRLPRPRRRPVAPYALLGLIAIRPMTGYELRQWMEKSLAHFWSESFGSIYPALARLERDGWVRRAGRPAGGRQRQVFAITAAGKAALEAWQAEPPALDARPRSELLLKLFFGEFAPPDRLRDMVRQFGREQARELTDLEALSAQLPRDASSAALPFWRLALSRGIAVARARLAWAEEAEASLVTSPSRRGQR